MTIADLFTMVGAFHKAIGQSPNDRPSEITLARSELRQNLLVEECDELVVALSVWERCHIERGLSPEQKTRYANVAKEACDVLYVTIGALLEVGITPDQLVRCFAAVNASNMSKTDSVKRNAEGKVIKGDAYEAPDLVSILWD